MSCASHGCKEPEGAQYHCAACHQTFGSLSLFDGHQDVDYNRPQRVLCREPETLSLLLDGKGVWQTPEGLLQRAQRATRARDMRRRKAA